MFVNGQEVIYGEKDVVVFVFGDEEKDLIASMAEDATCLAIYDPEQNGQEEVSEALTKVKQQCAINPLSRA
jgi:hypothetical protein